MYLADVFKQYGDKKLSNQLNKSLDMLVKAATGDLHPEDKDAADK